jgi:hypothetical protein
MMTTDTMFIIFYVIIIICSSISIVLESREDNKGKNLIRLLAVITYAMLLGGRLNTLF